jgi:hypothetical protein
VESDESLKRREATVRKDELAESRPLLYFL